MAVEFADGVIFGADSRTSLGSYVANRVTDKLHKITDKIYCCRSGSSADTQAIADIVEYSMNYHEYEFWSHFPCPAILKTNNKSFNRNQTGNEPLVGEAASEFRNYCYNYRDSLVAGIIVAGWDKELGGQVYSIPLGGMLIRQSCTVGGSGSSYVYGFVREFYRPGMQKEECMEFVKKSKNNAYIATPWWWN